jgi:hypothetical protein
VSRRTDALAVVKSEDGMISVHPELRPQVRRSEIRARVAALRAVAEKDDFDAEALGKAIDWLEEHEFYLTQDECDEANRLHERAQARKAGDVMYVARQKPFTPDPEMNDSYCLPE